MIDLHIHSTISHDGKASLREHCQKAIELGLKEAGFAEHLDLNNVDPHAGLHDYKRYQAEIEQARREFPALAVRMGVEASFMPQGQKTIRDFLEGKEYDYVLAAVHMVEGGKYTVSEEGPCRDFFSRRSAKECYEEFFELTLAAVKSGLFDAVAHLDVINRYGLTICPDWEWRLFYGLIRRIFERMTKRGMALEINTSGFRQTPGRPYPDRDLLKLYRELGGQMITIGSDAHKIENLASGVPQALKMARELGFSRVVTFERRNPKWLKI